jgi:hypothetical protein
VEPHVRASKLRANRRALAHLSRDRMAPPSPIANGFVACSEKTSKEFSSSTERIEATLSQAPNSTIGRPAPGQTPAASTPRPTVSGEHQGSAIRGYNTRSATDYRLLAVSCAPYGRGAAVGRAAVTEWLGHQAPPLASRSLWEWACQLALLLRLRLVSALAVSLHLNTGLTSTHLANQPNALQPT